MEATLMRLNTTQGIHDHGRRICLMSRDEQSILVVTYAELRHCLEQSFDEISSLATTTKAA
ncbi:PAB-dependent poly(A)-specific ribonuclease subunit 3 [Homalodisca vitripennis]|nr:PAB-dependent poly(A)-specific ribonuclease subunit 3 [Homalodisca vitripennis]